MQACTVETPRALASLLAYVLHVLLPVYEDAVASVIREQPMLRYHAHHLQPRIYAGNAHEGERILAS